MLITRAKRLNRQKLKGTRCFVSYRSTQHALRLLGQSMKHGGAVAKDRHHCRVLQRASLPLGSAWGLGPTLVLGVHENVLISLKLEEKKMKS